jgi:hypothetical protein
MKNSIRLTLAIGPLALLLTACSPPADQPETTWQERPADVVDEVEPEPTADGRPNLAEFSADEISAIRKSSDEAVMAMAEDNLACKLLSADDLAEVFGGEWSEGSFRWFETELQIAPAALEGICVWQQQEFRTSVTLRVYAWSELAWASLLQHDSAFARRFYDRPLDSGPERGQDAYRKPLGETGHDGTCLALDEHILCLSASARHTEQWVEDDQRLLDRAIERLAAQAD